MSTGPILQMTASEGIVKNGLELGGRRFEPLAYSTSPLPEHAVWFMPPFERDGVPVDSELTGGKGWAFPKHQSFEVVFQIRGQARTSIPVS